MPWLSEFKGDQHHHSELDTLMCRIEARLNSRPRWLSFWHWLPVTFTFSYTTFIIYNSGRRCHQLQCSTRKALATDQPADTTFLGQVVQGVPDVSSIPHEVETAASSSHRGRTRARSQRAYTSSQVARRMHYRYPSRERWLHPWGRPSHGHLYTTKTHRQSRSTPTKELTDAESIPFSSDTNTHSHESRTAQRSPCFSSAPPATSTPPTYRRGRAASVHARRPRETAAAHTTVRLLYGTTDTLLIKQHLFSTRTSLFIWTLSLHDPFYCLLNTLPSLERKTNELTKWLNKIDFTATRQKLEPVLQKFNISQAYGLTKMHKIDFLFDLLFPL